MSRDLSSLLCPRSVAVVGASPRQGSVAGEILRNIVRCGYRGKIYPVNPKYDRVEGFRCFHSVDALPCRADLAVLAVNRDLVLDVVQRCGKAGIHNLVIVTAGFKESGEEGSRREARLKELVQRYHLNVVGPNCMGIINSSPEASLNASFSRWFPTSGEIAFISQSGSLGETVLEFFGDMGLGVSLFINLGNRAGLSENDFLTCLAADDRIRVIFLYLESFANPVEFRRLVEEVGQKKPIVVLKAGRTEAGAAAVASHTGSLASSDAIVDAFLNQCGAIRVSSIEEMLTALRALERGHIPRGRRTVILTNAGGAGIIAADACERAGIEVLSLPAAVKDKLASFLPPEAGLGNPIDMIATADSADYEQALRIALSVTDSVIVIFRPPLVLKEPTGAVAKGILRAIAEAPDKPVIVCTLSHGAAAARFIERLAREKIPTYIMPEAAVDALSVLCRLGELRSERRSVDMGPKPDRERALRLVEKARSEGRCALYFYEGAEILSSYGLPVCPYTYVKDVEGAAPFLKEVGFPLVAKVDSPGLFHRFERGAVIPGIANGEDLHRAIDHLIGLIASERLHRGRILLQPALFGRELILGMKRDCSFGPVIMFGVGGTLVEALKDVSFGVAPVSVDQAERMIRSIRAFPLLEAFRGQPPVELGPLAGALHRLGQLCLDLPSIEEVDLNPFIVGKRTAAVDILIKLKEQ